MDDQIFEELAIINKKISDLESLVHEELVAIQFEVLGARDALSEELLVYSDSIKRQIRLSSKD